MYIVDAAHRAGFFSLADAFITQLRNFTCVQKNGLSVICLAMYKPELRSIRNLFWKDKNVYLYVKQFVRVFVKKEMSFLVHSKNLRLKSSQFSLEKILDFFFSILDQVYLKQALFICSILRTCTSSSIKLLTANATDLADDVTPDIHDEMVLY